MTCAVVYLRYNDGDVTAPALFTLTPTPGRRP